MTTKAKRQLSTTIRGLRARLLEDLHAATESAYRLSVRVQDADLSEAAAVKRQRLEDWLAEQERADAERGKRKRSREDFRRDVEKQAAYTLLNRLVILRLMETAGLRKPLVLTGGWESQGYKDFRQVARAWSHTTIPKATRCCCNWCSKIWRRICLDCMDRNAWPSWWRSQSRRCITWWKFWTIPNWPVAGPTT
jgi:hypothetical protein